MFVHWATRTLSKMAKNKHQEALRQRNTRRRKKREHDKYKAFYKYVFSQDPELVLSFEARKKKQTKDFLDSTNTQMAYSANIFAL